MQVGNELVGNKLLKPAPLLHKGGHLVALLRDEAVPAGPDDIKVVLLQVPLRGAQLLAHARDDINRRRHGAAHQREIVLRDGREHALQVHQQLPAQLAGHRARRRKHEREVAALKDVLFTQRLSAASQ